MCIRDSYVDMPMRLTVRQNLTVFGKLYAVKNLSLIHISEPTRPY